MRALYTELWHACAGPLVTVPRERERVFYFPQGHIEQVEASTNQVADQQMPVCAIPWKILCRVMNVELKDMGRQPPTQELVAKDLHGTEWRFRHIFRGQPRRHLLQSGWSVFVSSKRLVARDAFIFLVNETKLDEEVKSWLAFAAQKILEVNALANALTGAKDGKLFSANAAAQASRRSSPRVNDKAVQKAASALRGSDHRRATPVTARLDAQQKKLNLPILPTTTIGSFPQTMDLRRVRREFKAKKMSLLVK